MLGGRHLVAAFVLDSGARPDAVVPVGLETAARYRACDLASGQVETRTGTDLMSAGVRLQGHDLLTSWLKYADGASVSEAFLRGDAEYMPGLHGAVWFETVYQDPADDSGRTLYALDHNENYPETLPRAAPTPVSSWCASTGSATSGPRSVGQSRVDDLTGRVLHLRQVFG